MRVQLIVAIMFEKLAISLKQLFDVDLFTLILK